ncbi:hypothetical protein [Microbacterium sp.]|uniref:hypothetical protein n=1 Tax=Microbacterium sp. TaxID=51671 RepID=UPI003A948049
MVARPRPDRPEDELWVLLERIDRTELTAMLRSASVHDGRTRFVGNESLIVEGSQKVSGWLIVTGTERITGTLEILGELVLSGSATISGTVSLTGTMNVTGDIKVLPGGKIQVGSIVIDPTISGGAVTFANGAQVFTDASTIQVYKGNSVVQVSDSYARLQYGGSVISIGNDGIRMSGMETRTTSETGMPVNSIGIDGQTIYRVVAV